MSVARVRIDIWSDVVCPWCAIGWGQLQKALRLLDGEIEADIRWRPFELNPDMPPEGEEQAAHIARKYRRPPEQAQAVREHMREAARDAGVSLDYEGEGDPPPAMMWNTFAAHRLLEWTLEHRGPEAQTRLKLALLRAHFNHRRRIGEEAVLLEVARECGRDGKEAAAALEDDAIAKRVRALQAEAWDRNISGVPAMVIEGGFLVPGAQPPETYANVLRRVVSKRQARG